MRCKLRTAVTIGVASAALSACTDQPTSVPANPRVTGVNASIANLPATECNFTTLRAAVRDYVASGSDIIYDHIRDMGTDPYGEGMNGLYRLAEVRATTELKKAGATAAQGAAAVIQFLACMPIGDAVQDGFATNIVAAMDAGGMFEVPTTSSVDPIFSRGKPAGAQFWAAKPAGLGTTWGSLTGGDRFMVFGYEIPNGFDYNVVPMLGQAVMPPSFTGSLIIGACDNDPFPTSVRVKHEDDVLLDENMGFCVTNSPPLASLSSSVGANFASLVRRSLSVFGPQPLYAAVFGGGVGGAVSELSPSNLLAVTPAIEFAPQPATNASIGVPLGVKVRVFTGASWASGDPLNNAAVTLTVTGNSGLNALFLDPKTNTICHYVTRTTGELPGNADDGIADFSDVSVIKAGGYTLTASATWDQLTATTVPSNLFNVKNKKISGLPGTCPPA